jgi:hypothetical protein
MRPQEKLHPALPQGLGRAAQPGDERRELTKLLNTVLRASRSATKPRPDGTLRRLDLEHTLQLGEHPTRKLWLDLCYGTS